MSKTNIQELREMSLEELHTRLAELKQEALNLRLQQATGQLENTARRRQVRREIARVMTLATEKRNAAAS